MTAADTRADAMAILGLMNIPRIGARSIHRILDALRELETAAGMLLDYDAESLVEQELLSEQQAETFVSDEQREWREGVLAHLEDAEGALLPIASPGYPDHLRCVDPAPVLLTVRGDIALLEAPGIAFAGSRTTSDCGLEIARTLAAMCVDRRFTVVSGGAAGTDTAVHEEALHQGGATIVVLAEGMLSPRGRQLEHLAEEGNVALVSTFMPYDGWQAWRAMERNRCILGLSDRLIVIEAGATGGTIAAGREALSMGMSTWVIDYEEPPVAAQGNRPLIELGARPIRVLADGTMAVPPETLAIGDWVVTDAGASDGGDSPRLA